MPAPMVILSVQSSGLLLDLRVNDIRQHVRRDATPSRFSARLNPWLRSGANELTLVAARVPPTAVQGKPHVEPESHPLELALSVQAGLQGQDLPETGQVLQQAFAVEELQRLAVGRGSVLVNTTFQMGVLPWQNPVPDLPEVAFDAGTVQAFLQRYLQALQQGDLAWVREQHRPQFSLMGKTLQLDPSALEASFLRRVSSVPPMAWTLVPASQVVPTSEGYGRYCRVEATDGGPVLRPGAGAASGLSFLLMQANGRLWVLG